MSNSTTATTPEQYWAIVPAAGVGKRMQANCPKQYLPLAGRPVIEHTLERLAQHPRVTGIIVVIGLDDTYWADVNLDNVTKPVMTAIGGYERCHSVFNGLKILETKARADDWVLVHDAARPCIRVCDIEQLIRQCENTDGGLLGVRVKDTMKQVDERQHVAMTLNRDLIWHALTPQMFRYGDLCHALEQGMKSENVITDEAMAMELAGYKPRLVQGHADNIKITQPDDLVMAEFYLQQQMLNINVTHK